MKPPIKTDYPLCDLVKNRWSPRFFADRELDRESIMTLFEAARWAASMNNFQPWRFIYAVKGTSDRYEKLFNCLKEGNRAWAATAPLLILTLAKVTIDPAGKPNAWALHDLGLAVGNLTTQATAMGLFVHNMAGFDKETAVRSFNLSDGIEPVTMIAAGYLGDPERLSEPLRARELAPQERKPLDEIIIA